MDIVTLAMCKPKVIDLNDYGMNPTNIGMVVLSLANQGGGTMTIDNVGSFWDDVTADKQLVLKMDYPGGFDIKSSGVVLLRNTTSNNVIQVSFSALLYDASSGIMDIKVSVALKVIDEWTDGATINVKVS